MGRREAANLNIERCGVVVDETDHTSVVDVDEVRVTTHVATIIENPTEAVAKRTTRVII